ncbi:SPOR domain-containing protein [uncultured Limnobacter sp.]|uniref:SPOR domain-containing protein n=1 Tax=Limnobacter sp. TaxID=2003368 RepID=UPI0030F88584
MVFGLLIALGVALFVSKSQLPFSGAETQGAVPNVSPGPGNSPPDPNTAIYGKANANQGNVVTIDPFQQGTEPQTGDGTPIQQIEPVAQAIYFLQLGSFRNREDAEQLRAQLAFVGTESEIAVGEVNGNVVNRVRVGPFGSANEAYQARIPLTKGGFEATVVKE